jgi:hypothetical protein
VLPCLALLLVLVLIRLQLYLLLSVLLTAFKTTVGRILML